MDAGKLRWLGSQYGEVAAGATNYDGGLSILWYKFMALSDQVRKLTAQSNWNGFLLLLIAIALYGLLVVLIAEKFIRLLTHYGCMRSTPRLNSRGGQPSGQQHKCGMPDRRLCSKSELMDDTEADDDEDDEYECDSNPTENYDIEAAMLNRVSEEEDESEPAGDAVRIKMGRSGTTLSPSATSILSNAKHMESQSSASRGAERMAATSPKQKVSMDIQELALRKDPRVLKHRLMRRATTVKKSVAASLNRAQHQELVEQANAKQRLMEEQERERAKQQPQHRKHHHHRHRDRTTAHGSTRATAEETNEVASRPGSHSPRPSAPGSSRHDRTKKRSETRPSELQPLDRAGSACSHRRQQHGPPQPAPTTDSLDCEHLSVLLDMASPSAISDSKWPEIPNDEETIESAATRVLDRSASQQPPDPAADDTGSNGGGGGGRGVRSTATLVFSR